MQLLFDMYLWSVGISMFIVFLAGVFQLRVEKMNLDLEDVLGMIFFPLIPIVNLVIGGVLIFMIGHKYLEKYRNIIIFKAKE